MSGLMDLLIQMPSAQDRFLSLLPLLRSMGAQPQSGGGGGTGRSYGPVSTGSVLQPNDPSLVSKRGAELQRPAMRSLMDIARQSNVLPGVGEMRRITDSYRSPAEQAAAYAAKPGVAAPPGHSYHQQGLAIDASWWTEHPELARALADAGWNQFSPSGEPWHWSYKVTG